MNKFDVIDMKITTDYKKKSYRWGLHEN